jgi:transposase
MDKGIKVFVGLDVHKDSISVGVAEATGGEARFVCTLAHDVVKLIKLLGRYGEPAQVQVVYEAGPTGYGLYRELCKRGYACQVIAPSLIPKRAGVRIKTDRRDGVKLAGLSRAGELTAVWVPDAADEAMRDLVRAREDAVEARHGARMQLKAFLLRQGVRYSGKTSWGPAHARWLATLGFAHPAQQLAFAEYWQAVRTAHERVERFNAALGQALEGWRFELVVGALMSLRGLDLVSALTLVAEIGDIARFASARELMGYLGLVPSEHSSGTTLRKGGITKTGNAHARRVLTEAAWNYRFGARISRGLSMRQDSVAEPIRAISWKAQLRLCGRFRALSARGVHQNKVCVAVARELAGFVWAIARQVGSPATHA